MNYHHKTEYVLPLGRTTTDELYARVIDRTLYVHNDRERLGYAILEYRPRAQQRTINDYLD